MACCDSKRQTPVRRSARERSNTAGTPRIAICATQRPLHLRTRIARSLLAARYMRYEDALGSRTRRKP